MLLAPLCCKVLPGLIHFLGKATSCMLVASPAAVIVTAPRDTATAPMLMKADGGWHVEFDDACLCCYCHCCHCSYTIDSLQWIMRRMAPPIMQSLGLLLVQPPPTCMCVWHNLWTNVAWPKMPQPANASPPCTNCASCHKSQPLAGSRLAVGETTQCMYSGISQMQSPSMP